MKNLIKSNTHLLGNDGGFNHVPEPSDGGIDVLGIDDVLLVVETDADLPLLLLPAVLGPDTWEER